MGYYYVLFKASGKPRAFQKSIFTQLLNYYLNKKNMLLTLMKYKGVRPLNLKKILAGTLYEHLFSKMCGFNHVQT
jgi:hypothetical protein